MVEEEEDSQFLQKFYNFLPDKTASNHRSSYFSRDTEFIKSGLLVLSAAHTTPYSSAIQLVVNEPWLGCVGTGTLGLSLIPPKHVPAFIHTSVNAESCPEIFTESVY